MLLFYVYNEFLSLFSFCLQITGVEKRICTYSRKGRAIAQAVSRRLPTAAARVRVRVISCGICSG
jgi:hypothetical protein